MNLAVSEPKRKPKDESRRQFLKNSGFTLGGLVVGGAIGGLIGESQRAGPKETAPPAKAKEPETSYNQALMHFTQEQFQITEAATERIFPKDDLGPGAKELGVAYFIDHQLAGQWGVNARDYMMGPFHPGEETQGYQARMKRKEIFTAGIEALNQYAIDHYGGKAFTELDGSQQDEVLAAFEKGDKATIDGLTRSSVFFDMLRQLTLEGAYADPMYGGNIQMKGWKMRNYPGTHMSYYDDIEKDKFIKYDPESLHHMMTS